MQREDFDTQSVEVWRVFAPAAERAVRRCRRTATILRDPTLAPEFSRLDLGAEDLRCTCLKEWEFSVLESSPDALSLGVERLNQILEASRDEWDGFDAVLHNLA